MNEPSLPVLPDLAATESMNAPRSVLAEPADPFLLAARVRVASGGRYVGRVGAVQKVLAGSFAHCVVVRLDPVPRERVVKEFLFEKKMLEPEGGAP